MTKRKTLLALTGTLLLGWTVAQAVLAAAIVTAGRPLAPAVGYAIGRGTHLVVWAEDRGLGTGLDLYAARANAAGVVAGTDIPLVVEPGDQSDPAVAYSDNLGEFLVVYTQTGGPNVTPTPGVPIPGTPPVGTPPPFPTPPAPPDLAELVNPVAAPWGSAVVGPGSGDTTAWRRHGRAVERAQPNTPPPVPTVATSTPPATPPPAPTLPTPGGPTVPPTAVPPPVGTPPVPPPSTAPGSRDVYGVWVSPGGVRLTVSFAIVASPADDTFPSLAYRPNTSQDQWILVWREVTGLDVALKGVELTGFGRVMIYSSAVNTIVAGADHSRPSVAGHPDGRFLVTWSQTETGEIDRDVLGRRLNANGYPSGPIIKLVGTRDDQVYPSLGALRDTGDYLLAWEERSAGNAPDIRVRRLNRNGIPLRAAYDLAAGPPFSFAPSLPDTDRPTLLLVWLDRDSASDHSVMGSELTREGRRIGAVRTIVRGGGMGAVTPAPPPGPGLPTPPVPPPPGFPTPTP